MIVADKKVLEANLAKGTLSIQYKLNILYRTNLNSLATQAALIATIGLVGFQQGNDYAPPNDPGSYFASLLLFVGLNVGTIASFIAYTLSTVEVIWGPIMGLSGDHHSEVIEATRHMLIQQNESMVWLSSAVFGILSTPYFYVLLLVDWKCALPLLVAIVVGCYVIWTEGMKAYQLFNHDAAWKDLDNAVYRDYHEAAAGKSRSAINTKAAISAATTFLSGSASSLAQKEVDQDLWFKEQIETTNEVPLPPSPLLSPVMSRSGSSSSLPVALFGSNPSNFPLPLVWRRAIVSRRCMRTSTMAPWTSTASRR
jgi:hypothetical protein